MATDTNLEKWKTAQIQAAIACGVNPIDATRAMAEFLAAVPLGATPIGFIRPAATLNQDLKSKAIRDDANGDWYGKVEPRVARLLDAGAVK